MAGSHRTPFLSTRQREAEWMDEPQVDPRALRTALRFIRWVNAGLGYTRATLSHLDRFSRTWPGGRRVTILDVATGSADVPLAIARWASRRKLDVRVVGLDLHQATLAAAREAVRDEPRVTIVRGDALDLPFADRSFDYAMSSMFLHHLDDDQVLRVLREMDRVARCGVLTADLLRNRRAYAWIWLGTLLTNPMVRHDARVSVQQAFSPAEARALGERAGLRYLRYHHHLAHRFVLAGEKCQLSHSIGRV